MRGFFISTMKDTDSKIKKISALFWGSLFRKPHLAAYYLDDWSAELTDRSSDKASGTVLQLIKNIGIEVATEDNNLIIKEVQPAGKKIMSAHAFNLGAKIQPGEKFENGF